MGLKPIAHQFADIPDPGDGLAIPAHRGGIVKLVTAGAETRTLAAPTCPVGSKLVLSFDTDGGNCVVTVASEVNVAANNTITLADVNECVTLQVVTESGALRWSVLHSDLNTGTITTV